LHAYFPDLAVAADTGGLRREFGQGFNRPLGPAHGGVLQRMAQAEQEQQQGAFGPSTERCRTSGGDQHQRVDLEAFELQVLNRFSDGIETTKEVGTEIVGDGEPICDGRPLVQREAGGKKSSAQQGEYQFTVFAKDTGVTVSIPVTLRVLIAAPFMRKGFGLSVDTNFRERVTNVIL